MDITTSHPGVLTRLAKRESLPTPRAGEDAEQRELSDKTVKRLYYVAASTNAGDTATPRAAVPLPEPAEIGSHVNQMAWTSTITAGWLVMATKRKQARCLPAPGEINGAAFTLSKQQ